MPTTTVSFVCLGNICRSPLAEVVFRRLVEQAGLAHAFHVESAGIGDWHVGDPADRRAQATARGHGLTLAGRAQQFHLRDFSRLDAIFALDSDVASALRRMAPSPADRAKVRLLREFDPLVDGQPGKDDLDVPDPYYGGLEGFENVYQMIERSCRRLLETLASTEA